MYINLLRWFWRRQSPGTSSEEEFRGRTSSEEGVQLRWVGLGISWEQFPEQKSSEGRRVLRPPPSPTKPYKKQQMERIKATALQRKVSKHRKTQRKRVERKTRGVGRGVQKSQPLF